MSKFQDTNRQLKPVPDKCCEMPEHTMNFGVREQYCIMSFCSSVDAGQYSLYSMLKKKLGVGSPYTT